MLFSEVKNPFQCLDMTYQKGNYNEIPGNRNNIELVKLPKSRYLLLSLLVAFLESVVQRVFVYGVFIPHIHGSTSLYNITILGLINAH